MVHTRSMGPPGSPRTFVRDSELRTEFPFRRLPMELRLHVWKMYCDDMALDPRILSFDVTYGKLGHGNASASRRLVCATIGPGTFLSEQTRELRRVLAVHRESRYMALALFPDTLTLDYKGSVSVIRFSKRRDICLLVFPKQLRYLIPRDAMGNGFARDLQKKCLAGFKDQVVNIATPSTALGNIGMSDADVPPWTQLLTALERLFVFENRAASNGSPTRGQWLPAMQGHSHVNMFGLRAPNLVHDNRKICTLSVCWPIAHQATAGDRAKWSQWLASHLNMRESSFRQAFANPNIEIRPMVSIGSGLPENQPAPAWSRSNLSNVPWPAAYQSMYLSIDGAAR